jgi:hypothetical protein
MQSFQITSPSSFLRSSTLGPCAALLESAPQPHEGLRTQSGSPLRAQFAASRSRAGKLPLVGRVELPSVYGGCDVWVCTGFGSRALIHSAYVAKQLVQVSGDARRGYASPPIPGLREERSRMHRRGITQIYLTQGVI